MSESEADVVGATQLYPASIPASGAAATQSDEHSELDNDRSPEAPGPALSRFLVPAPPPVTAAALDGGPLYGPGQKRIARTSQILGPLVSPAAEPTEATRLPPDEAQSV